MTDQHTPGPWKATSTRIDYFTVTRPYATPERSPGTEHEYIADVKGLANARLIASAPVLLAALQTVRDTFEGEPWPADHVNLDCDPPCSRCAAYNTIDDAIARATGTGEVS